MNPVLSWDDDPAVYQWKVELRTVITQPGEVRYVHHSLGPQIEWDGLESLQSYWWFVSAVSWWGNLGPSSARQFTTESDGLATPTAIRPANGSECASPTPELVSSTSSSGSSFEFEWGSDCSFGSSGTSTNYRFTIPEPLERGQTYYWRSREMHACGQVSPWSACSSFTVDSTPPDNPPLLWAQGHQVGAWSTDNEISIDWDTVSDECYTPFFSLVGYSYHWDQAPDTWGCRVSTGSSPRPMPAVARRRGRQSGSSPRRT